FLGHADAEGFPETVRSRRGDDHGAAVLHPFGPAQIETTLGEGGPYGARNVWPSFGPIEAQSTEVAAFCTQGRQVDSELREKSSARLRDFSGLVADRDVFMCDQRSGEINAETTGKVVVADSGRAKLACL